jgi:hypothetical protein
MKYCTRTLNLSCIHFHHTASFEYHGFRSSDRCCPALIINRLKSIQPWKAFFSTNADKRSNENATEFTSRNRILQAVIREGLVHINYGASWIQKNQVAQRSILQTKKSSAKSNTIYDLEEVDSEKMPSPRQLSEAKRLLTAASRSLQEICDKNPYQLAPFMINNEPITLLTVNVRPSLKHADLYWTLPTDILLDNSLTIMQKIKLQHELQIRIESAPDATGMWMRRIYTILSRYYPAKIRLQAATPMMIQEVIIEFDGDEA